MKLVVDTSILIDYLRGGFKWEDFLETVEKEAQLLLPTIVIFELFSGQSSSDTMMARDIWDVSTYFQKIDLNEKIARRAGELFRDTTHVLGAPDYIIAASALEVGAHVVTLNTKHFKKIPGLSIYQIS